MSVSGQSVRSRSHAGTQPGLGEKRVGQVRNPNSKRAIENEAAILGAVLFEPNKWPQIAELHPECFVNSQNRKVFAAMRLVAEKGLEPGPIAVAQEFDDEDEELIAYATSLPSFRDPTKSGFALLVTNLRRDAAVRTLHTLHAQQGADLESSNFSSGELRVRALHILTIAEELEAPRASQTQKFFDTWEEFETTPELSFAVESFLQNDGITLIGGLSGHAKTLMMMSIAKALIAGARKLWDLFPVVARAERLIYLIPESSRTAFKHRLQILGMYDHVRTGRLLVRTLSKGPTPLLTDSSLLHEVKGLPVVLDTAIRFAVEGDESSASDNQRGLATGLFGLQRAGAKLILAAHHSPKTFAKDTIMTLENTLRGSGDIGAMLSTAYGVKQLDKDSNIIHIENIKPRDFQPPAPFQLIGRPFIDEEGDFRAHKKPGECGALTDEQEPERDKGGASTLAREAKAGNIALMRNWLRDTPHLNSTQLSHLFRAEGIRVGDSAIRKYRKEIQP
jgi:hypothetical protein